MRGLTLGGEFYAVIRVTSVNSDLQRELALHLQADLNGTLASLGLTSDFKTKFSQQAEHSEINISFYQKGGAGASENGVTLDVDEVRNRLHNLPDAILNHPFPYEVEVASYDTVPLPLPTKEQQDAFVLALADAEAQKLRYVELRNGCTFAIEFPDFFVDPPLKSDLMAAASVYTRALNAVLLHAIRLSKGEIAPSLFDPSSATPPIEFPAFTLRKKDTSGAKNFKDWYKLREGAIMHDDKLMINDLAWRGSIMISSFNSLTTEDQRADALAPVVAGWTEVSFSSKGLVTLGHIDKLLPPGIKKLDLSRNALSGLFGLEAFAELEDLNISGNRISGVSGLRRLTNLKALNLNASSAWIEPEFSHARVEATNPIAEITSLRAIPGLSNPFLIGERLAVRFGVEKDGPDAQLKGVAKQIGSTNRFGVELTRGSDTRTEEWSFVSIGPVGPGLAQIYADQSGFGQWAREAYENSCRDLGFPIFKAWKDMPPDWIVIVIHRSVSGSLRANMSFIKPDDRTKAFIPSFMDTDNETFEAAVVP